MCPDLCSSNVSERNHLISDARRKQANHDSISSDPNEPIELDIVGSVLRVNQWLGRTGGGN